MLELKGIKKDYPAGDTVVHALKGIDLKFRENEFVSVLGPSGCGKTTMLNIIGGLDKYTEGDLVINGRSTKSYKDRDWDAYRNHSVGFVFQSYNLIPHQTVLQNVELALTLSGVPKSERRERAVKALEEVGLGSQLSKKPSEMSGGQMQRVAIARALVNDPDIILADEPTGALDSETGIQVMEILKKVAEKRLIIMVTHNPELAEKYSTRIIRMLDGEIIDDSKPLSSVEEAAELDKAVKKSEAEKGRKKPSMSWATSFGLSLKNLFTKKGRTMLTSFAGSIGIIGIALIYAVSQGMTAYIDTVQEQTLASYPLTIQAEHTDMGALMEMFSGRGQSTGEHENDAVYKATAFYEMMNSFNSLEAERNDLKAFKAYLDERVADENDDTGLHGAVNGVMYSYDLDLVVYTQNVDGDIIRSDTKELLGDLMREYSGGMSVGMSMGASSMWQEMLPGTNGDPVNDILRRQYDVLYGAFPARYDEIVLVLNDNNEIDDTTLFALGLIPKSEITAIMEAASKGTEVEIKEEKWSYEEICAMEFVAVPNSDCFVYDKEGGKYTDLRESETGLKMLYSGGIPLKVTGVIKPREDATAAMLSSGIAYTSDLTRYIIERSAASEAVKAQQSSPETDVLTGLPFNTKTGSLSVKEKAEEFRKYIGVLSDEEKGELYIDMMSVPSDEYIAAAVRQVLSSSSRAELEDMLIQSAMTETGMDADTLKGYFSAMSDEEFTAMVSQMVAEQTKAAYAEQVKEQLAAMSSEQLTAAFGEAVSDLSDEQAAAYYDSAVKFSPSTCEENLLKLGCIDLASPSAISIYAASFEDKDIIISAIDDYNKNVDELREIKYTDLMGIMMSGITAIINAITYVLISFVAISLIVSSIMIGVITLISVQERTKEIGILRAIGASKKNVSGMFNAETIIIGFVSGALGVLITVLLCVPINLIIHAITGISSLSATLPVPVAVTLIVISCLLTLVSGVIPSRSAAKKDPVVALRTE